MHTKSLSASTAALALNTLLLFTAPSCDGGPPVDPDPETQVAEAELAAGAESPHVESAPHALIGEFHTIRLSNTNLCVQPRNRSREDVPVELRECSPSEPAQNWLIRRISARDFMIVNAQSGKCLYVDGRAAANVPIVHASCNVYGGTAPASNALWKPSRLTGEASLMSRIGQGNSGLCADSFGNAFPGIGLRTFGCDGSARQKFVVGVE